MKPVIKILRPQFQSLYSRKSQRQLKHENTKTYANFASLPDKL